MNEFKNNMLYDMVNPNNQNFVNGSYHPHQPVFADSGNLNRVYTDPNNLYAQKVDFRNHNDLSLQARMQMRSDKRNADMMQMEYILRNRRMEQQRKKENEGWFSKAGNFIKNNWAPLLIGAGVSAGLAFAGPGLASAGYAMLSAPINSVPVAPITSEAKKDEPPKDPFSHVLEDPITNNSLQSKMAIGPVNYHPGLFGPKQEEVKRPPRVYTAKELAVAKMINETPGTFNYSAIYDGKGPDGKLHPKIIEFFDKEKQSRDLGREEYYRKIVYPDISPDIIEDIGKEYLEHEAKLNRLEREQELQKTIDPSTRNIYHKFSEAVYGSAIPDSTKYGVRKTK